jgi:hypothetical protein
MRISRFSTGCACRLLPSGEESRGFSGRVVTAKNLFSKRAGVAGVTRRYQMQFLNSPGCRLHSNYYMYMLHVVCMHVIEGG